ncbi:hypothetical protein GRS66_008127 [Saccharomyces pastorianus]|uniref:Uncharacterized protein n=1 Tax=Saccharomyces pastorianus TaxID=27292 RepID=A0A6C1E830_SACPS|nr:hypothetical protein GRS66_008127 [Saccharomyces pastorianus]
MGLYSQVLDSSRGMLLNNNSNGFFTDGVSRGDVLCGEHHSFDKGLFKTTIRAFSYSIKLGLRGNPEPKETVSIFQSEDSPCEYEYYAVCMAFSWFIFGLFIACLLLSITLLLTARYHGGNNSSSGIESEAPLANINDEEKQQQFSDIAL